MAVALLAGLAACAGLPGKAPQDIVQERAQARWDALVRGDFKAAYGYLSPASRSVTSEESYINGLGRNFWKAAQVKKVACPTEKTCDVDVSIEYEFKGMRTRTPLRETWIREDSEWWYVKLS